jgi:hypothetical protein
MTAKQVNINTQAHTQLTGSLIAATDTGDKDGNDNGQLNLTTNSLSASSLVLALCLFCTLDTSRFLVSVLSWLVACRLAPLILVSWVVLRLMLVAVRLVLLWAIANTNLNTPNKTTTIIGSNLQANAVNTNNGQININSQNLNILSKWVWHLVILMGFGGFFLF